jgi:hypothetical protein
MQYIRTQNLRFNHLMQCFQNLLLPGPFWLRGITVDPHILPNVNIKCPDDRHRKLKIYILEPMKDGYKYLPLA